MKKCHHQLHYKDARANQRSVASTRTEFNLRFEFPKVIIKTNERVIRNLDFDNVTQFYYGEFINGNLSIGKIRSRGIKT